MDNGLFTLDKHYKIPLNYTSKICVKYLSNIYL